MTIREFAAALLPDLARMRLAPPGAEIAAVEIVNGQGRKRRGNADLGNFGLKDQIRITFRARTTDDANPSAAPATQAGDLVRALADAERHPGHSFVSLKWFRDIYLPQAHAWAADSALRNRALRQAIDAGWVSVSRLANPKNPRFPTSALYVNRGNASVLNLLRAAEPRRWGFTPIKIEGEPLSETLRRMRDGEY